MVRLHKYCLCAALLCLPWAAAVAHEPVAVTDVPDVVMQAARQRMPDITVDKVLAETKNGMRIYTLEGKAGDKEYAIEVLSGGVVLGVYDRDYYEKNILD